MSPSMLILLHDRIGRIQETGIQLLSEFSGMHAANDDNDSVVFISVHGNHWWNALPPAGKQLQAQLLPQLTRFQELIIVLTRNLPKEVRSDLESTLQSIREAVEQQGSTWWKTAAEACEKFNALCSDVRRTIDEYFGTSVLGALVIPDTNALLANPSLEQWAFDGVPEFTIILTPTVLTELDHQKKHHRNDRVREKATTLIRKIKEYRRRGSLQESVPVVTNRITLRSIAHEPRMNDSLRWFDAASADDRFLATALEIIREHMATPTFIVTGDINMQNKAEFACIPFIEIPAATQIQEAP